MRLYLKLRGLECTLCKFPTSRCGGYVLSNQGIPLCVHSKIRVEATLRALPNTTAEVDLVTETVCVTCPDEISLREIIDTISDSNLFSAESFIPTSSTI